jgi:hypothetical protein
MPFQPSFEEEQMFAWEQLQLKDINTQKFETMTAAETLHTNGLKSMMSQLGIRTIRCMENQPNRSPNTAFRSILIIVVIHLFNQQST